MFAGIFDSPNQTNKPAHVHFVYNSIKDGNEQEHETRRKLNISLKKTDIRESLKVKIMSNTLVLDASVMLKAVS